MQVDPLLEPVLTYRMELPDERRPSGSLAAKASHACGGGSDAAYRLVMRSFRRYRSRLWERCSSRSCRRSLRIVLMCWLPLDAGRIVYKETIADRVEGVGHFEPLRHYAEVHLILEPGEPGSGLQCLLGCSEEQLDRNWQRLILTHLEERTHRGVLTGSAHDGCKDYADGRRPRPSEAYRGR